MSTDRETARSLTARFLRLGPHVFLLALWATVAWGGAILILNQREERRRSEAEVRELREQIETLRIGSDAPLETHIRIGEAKVAIGDLQLVVEELQTEVNQLKDAVNGRRPAE